MQDGKQQDIFSDERKKEVNLKLYTQQEYPSKMEVK